MDLFAAIVLALGVANSLLLTVLAVRRIAIARRAKRLRGAEGRLRPAVLAFLDGEGDLSEARTPGDVEAVADMLGSYARKLRGPARERIIAYFEQHGAVAAEERALAASHAAWRRATAAYRLGDIGTPRCVPALVAGLYDGDRDVRTAAVRSLGKLGDPSAVQPLLGAIAASHVPAALVGWALLQMGPDALPPLRAALTAEEPEHRAGAVRMLGLLGRASDADLVAERLRDSSADVRAAAAQALGRLGGPRNFEALFAALDDRVPGVRTAAAEALGRVRDPRALHSLLAHARDDQFDVARAAARAAAAVDLDATAVTAAATGATHLREAVDLARLA